MKRKKIWIGLGSVVGITFLLKLLFLMLPEVVMPPAAQAQFSTTTNYGMKKPNSGLTTGWDVYLNGNFDLLDGILGGMNTLTQNSTTPSVTVSSTYPINWKTNNTSTTAITNFTNGAAGQRITILCTDSNTSFASGTNISVVSPFTCVSGASISFVLNGTVWTEFARTTPDVLDVHIIPFCAAPGGTAEAGITYASGQWTPTLRAGSNNIGCALQAIPNTGAAGQLLLELPKDWDTSVQPFINIQYASGANTSGTVIWTVSSACVDVSTNGGASDDPTFHAESAFATQTMAAANRMWYQTGQFTAMTSGNGCKAFSPVIIKVAVSGTAASAINAYQAVLSIPRSTVMEAN